MLSGAGIAVTFPLTVFAGALEGLQKFSWLQLSQIGITLVRALLIVIALTSGGGLLAIGAITIAMNVFSYLVFTWLALHALPVRLSMRSIEWSALREMAGYGAFAFAILAAEKLRFQSDAMVIGALVSATAITSFSIAARLVEYSSYAVRSMSQIFTPMSSQFHAAGDLLVCDAFSSRGIAPVRSSFFLFASLWSSWGSRSLKLGLGLGMWTATSFWLF